VALSQKVTCNVSHPMGLRHYPVLPCLSDPSAGGQRPIGCLVFMGHFPRKSPIISAVTYNVSHPMGLHHPVLMLSCSAFVTLPSSLRICHLAYPKFPPPVKPQCQARILSLCIYIFLSSSPPLTNCPTDFAHHTQRLGRQKIANSATMRRP